MKYYCCVFSFALIATTIVVKAQNNYDQNWILGTGPDEVSYVWHWDDSLYWSGGSLIDFRETPPDTSKLSTSFGWGFGCFASMSDRKGDLVFYVNCCSVESYTGEQMKSGDSLSFPGLAWEFQCETVKLGYPFHEQGMVILPNPNSEYGYTIFHLWVDSKSANSRSLFYTTVDMSKDNGHGMVMSKNNMIMLDSLSDGITAVRHGNGRDWWVFNSAFGADYAYLTLLTPKGVGAPKQVKSLGRWNGPEYEVNMIGQSTFSPDGNLFARIDFVLKNGLQIAHFDRCAGEFFCPINIPWKLGVENPDDYPGEFFASCGVAFSPNSRFLYVSTGRRLYQFDMWADDVANSWVMVGKYDGFTGPLYATFNLLQLAPDGKIYMNATNSLSYLHVINNPDEKGLDCNFVNHGLKLPTVNQLSMPNFPHYRLYDAANSPCDTIGINAPEGSDVTRWNRKLQILPNPTNDLAKVELPVCRHGRLAVYSILGQLLMEFDDVDDKDAIYLDTNYWASGTYIVTLFSTGERPLSTRLMVVH